MLLRYSKLKPDLVLVLDSIKYKMRRMPKIFLIMKKKIEGQQNLFFMMRIIFEHVKKFEKVDPQKWGFFEKCQKMTFFGGSKKGSFFRILVPFFGLSVGIPALKKWGGYPIFRSILRRGDTPFLGVKKWPFFGGPKNGLFWGLIFRPKSKNQACFWICISRKMFKKKPQGFFFEQGIA